MKNTFTYQITDPAAHQTIEQFLLSTGYSGKLISHLRRENLWITIDGIRVYTTHILKPSESFTIQLPIEESSANIIAALMDLSIIYEDEDLLVVSKAAGVPIHPSHGHFGHT